MTTGQLGSAAATGRPRLASVAVAALLLALGACVPRAESGSDAAPERSPEPEVAAQDTPSGEVPADFLDKVIGDLVEKEGLQRDDIQVERAESVIWPDGALGCPQPGDMYTQAQVPGYWVVLRVGDNRYDYRMAAQGYFRRCSASFRVQLPVG